MTILNADTGVNLVQDNTITSAKIADGSDTFDTGSINVMYEG